VYFPYAMFAVLLSLLSYMCIAYVNLVAACLKCISSYGVEQ